MQRTWPTPWPPAPPGSASSASPPTGTRGRPVPSRWPTWPSSPRLRGPVATAGASSPCCPAACSPTRGLRAPAPHRAHHVDGAAHGRRASVPRGSSPSTTPPADGVEVWPRWCLPAARQFQMNLADPSPQHALVVLLDHGPVPRGAEGDLRGPGLAARGVDRAVRPEQGVLPFNWPSLSVAGAPNPTELVWPQRGRAGRGGAAPRSTSSSTSASTTTSPRFNSVLANDDQTPSSGCSPRRRALGLADSGAHVSQLCDACFSTDLLGNWVRDRGVMPLRAGHPTSSRPSPPRVCQAWTTGRVVAAAGRRPRCSARHRGPGAAAPGADFPADGERLTADAPRGVRHTLSTACPSASTARPAGRPLGPDGRRPAPSSRLIPLAALPAGATGRGCGRRGGDADGNHHAAGPRTCRSRC